MRPSSRRHDPSGAQRTHWTKTGVTAAGIAAALLVTGLAAPAASAAPLPTAKPSPEAPPVAPTLSPKDGAHLEGTVRFAADPTTAGDPVGGSPWTARTCPAPRRPQERRR